MFNKGSGVMFSGDVHLGTITDIVEENVVQSLLVSSSAIRLATETDCSIMLP